MVLHSGNILLFGGSQSKKTCLQLDDGTWKAHSTLNELRIAHSSVSTQTATFVFGGAGDSSTTYEYLPKDSTVWLMGKTDIPEGFTYGCAIEVKSGQEIWLIGGWTGKRILSFNINDHSFEVLPSQLNMERVGPKCAIIPNSKKVMITGGSNPGNHFKCLNSTEILDINTGSVHMASPMNYKRVDHGMGYLTINNKNTLAVFGGNSGRKMLDSVELYNTETKKWVRTSMRLKEPKAIYSFLNIKLSEIISKIQDA